MRARDPIDDVRRGFDAVAEKYAERFAHELDEKPFDRQLLEGFGGRIAPDGRVLDLGCGPAGQIGRELARRGLRVTGVDISAHSIELARSLVPEMDFVVADARRLPFETGSFAACVAFYSLIYGSDDDVLASLSEARRVLEPGGLFLAAVHGASTPAEEHFADFMGTPIDITLRLTTPGTFGTFAERAGILIERLTARQPSDSELPTTRIYLEGRAPA